MSDDERAFHKIADAHDWTGQVIRHANGHVSVYLDAGPGLRSVAFGEPQVAWATARARAEAWAPAPTRDVGGDA